MEHKVCNIAGSDLPDKHACARILQDACAQCLLHKSTNADIHKYASVRKIGVRDASSPSVRNTLDSLRDLMAHRQRYPSLSLSRSLSLCLSRSLALARALSRSRSPSLTVFVLSWRTVKGMRLSTSA